MGKCSVGVYSGKTLETYIKITEGEGNYIPNRVYKNETYNRYYYINQRGYLHVIEPYAVNIGIDKKIIQYAIRDFMMTKDNMFKDCGDGNVYYDTMEDAQQEINRRMQS